MKLSDVNYETESAKEVEITDHLGKSFDPKALIKVVSWKSKQGSKALIEMQREMMQAHKDEKADEDVINDIVATGLSKLIVSWSGIEDEKGKPLKFSPDNAKKVMQNKYIRDIVDAFASNLGNFKG